jgi:hypothetical protein
MKKKLFLVLLIIFVLALGTVTLVTASENQPQGDCPDEFHLHGVMDHVHDHQGEHRHVGNDRDLNGDGWICGKHVSNNGSVHVHIDNNVPLP